MIPHTFPKPVLWVAWSGGWDDHLVIIEIWRASDFLPVLTGEAGSWLGDAITVSTGQPLISIEKEIAPLQLTYSLVFGGDPFVGNEFLKIKGPDPTRRGRQGEWLSPGRFQINAPP